MSLGLQKIILSGAGSNTPGAFYLTTTIVARDTNTANTVVTAGAYVLPATANIAVQASTDNGSTWSTIAARGVGIPWLVSDGVNIRFLNDAGSNVTVTLLAVNGGQNATGTFNT